MFLIISLLYVLSVVLATDFIGPAQVVLQRIEKCDDFMERSLDATVHRINRTHQGIDINVYLINPLDTNVSVNLSVAKWGDGGWKPHFADTYEKDACAFFTKFAKEKFEYIVGLFNLPPHCPIPAGNYSLKKFVFDGQISIPAIYGEYKVDTMFYRKNELVVCTKIYGRTEPKRINLPIG